jgi:hypothetical protein
MIRKHDGLQRRHLRHTVEGRKGIAKAYTTNEEENDMAKVKVLNYEVLGAVNVTELPTGVTHIVQPPRSYICSQCSVAMVTGNDLKTVFETFGHSEASNLDEAYQAILALGYKESRYRRGIDNRKAIELDGMGVARIEVKGRRMGHMIAFKDGVIYDPAGYVFHSAKELRANYKARHGRAWTFDYILNLQEAN